MLFSLYPLISQNYFTLCLVVSLGVLQWAAARNHKPALSLLGPWGLGLTGQVVGSLLVIGGFVWFFNFTPGLFETGLAGGELSTLFSAASLSALGLARLGGAFWQKQTQRQAEVFTLD
jgi:hypothetical protein